MGSRMFVAGNIVGLFASVRTTPKISLRGVVACEDEPSAAAICWR